MSGSFSLEQDLGYTVHAPLAANLMDLTASGDSAGHPDVERPVRSRDRRRQWLSATPGNERAARDARFRLKDQLSAERSALREIGDMQPVRWT